MSMEPRPRCKLCIPAALFRCPISKIAQPVRCATCPSRMKIGRTSFARFMSTSAPRYAWIGSMMTSRALFSMMAFSIRSSESVSCTSLSSITSTRSRSAPASIRRGLTVSPRPSSAVWEITLKGSMRSMLGSSFPLVQAAARCINKQRPRRPFSKSAGPCAVGLFYLHGHGSVTAR